MAQTSLDRENVTMLTRKFIEVGKGFKREEVYRAAMNVIANIIMEGDPSPEEASELAILCGTDIAKSLDRYFKNLGPKP